MKTLASIILLIGLSAFGQSFQRNSFTTNSDNTVRIDSVTNLVVTAGRIGVGTNLPQASVHAAIAKAGVFQAMLFENVGTGDTYESLHALTGDSVLGYGGNAYSWHIGAANSDGSLHIFNNSFGSGTPYMTFEPTNSSRGVVTYRGIYDGTRIETAGPMVFGGAQYFGNGNTLFRAPSAGLLKLTDWAETISAQVQLGNVIVTNISAANQPSIVLATNSGNITASGRIVGTNGFFFPQGTNAAPTAAIIGGTVGAVTNHLLKNVGAGLIDYWSDGTTVWSKQIAP